MSATPNIRFYTQADNQPTDTASTETARTVMHPATILQQAEALANAFLPAPLKSIWEMQTTPTLQKVLAGFERSFDDLSTDPHKAQFLPSADYITSRMDTIRGILEVRWAEHQAMPVEMRNAYERVEAGEAKPVKRWDRKGGKGA